VHGFETLAFVVQNSSGVKREGERRREKEKKDRFGLLTLSNKQKIKLEIEPEEEAKIGQFLKNFFLSNCTFICESQLVLSFKLKHFDKWKK